MPISDIVTTWGLQRHVDDPDFFLDFLAVALFSPGGEEKWRIDSLHKGNKRSGLFFRGSARAKKNRNKPKKNRKKDHLIAG